MVQPLWSDVPYPLHFATPSRPQKRHTDIEKAQKLKYKSELLRFDHSRVETEEDWSSVYKVLSIELPEALNKLGVAGLVKQLKNLKEPGYVEKIWLGEINA